MSAARSISETLDWVAAYRWGYGVGFDGCDRPDAGAPMMFAGWRDGADDRDAGVDYGTSDMVARLDRGERDLVECEVCGRAKSSPVTAAACARRDYASDDDRRAGVVE